MSPPTAPVAHDGDENVSGIRQALGAEASALCTDEMIRRCLRADRGHLEHCTKRIVKTLKWREEVVPNPLVCSACAKNYGSHYLHHVGFDKIGRPVLYSVFNLAEDHGLETNTQHMVHCLEHAISVMGPKLEQQQWVWISDFSGFGFKNMNPKIGLAASTLFGTYYPERLGCFFILGAPGIFGTLYSLVARTLDPVTAEKIQFINKDDAMKENLSQVFDEELCDWVCAEVAQNERKDLRTRKKYASCSDPAGGPFTTAEEAPFLKPGAVIEGHNIHGPPSFIRFLKGQDLEWLQTFYHQSPAARRG